jgi:hypothetical protein
MESDLLGNIIDAHCTACNYKSSVTIGGTMRDFQTHSSWPVFCQDCGDMTSTNARAEPLICLTCQSARVTKYDAHHLVEGETREVAGWCSDHLTDGLYLCPTCRKQTLRFDPQPRVFFD